MGIDALDIVFRIERAFGVRPPGTVLYTGVARPAGRLRGPITVGDIHRHLCEYLVGNGQSVPPDSWQRVARCVGEALQYPPEEITPGHRLKEDLRADFG